ncbi:hypothetical protein BDV59DRAFT_189980 [Aspergillus ambiguus]|uniref:SET domain-containing protein n=1 Tax=Aspergillus ambiguus TaxID=176160 RepID=UPI003CCCEFDA
MLSTPPVAEKRLQATKDHLTRPGVSNITDKSWVHPHLRHTVDPIKGRQLQVSQLVKKGELLLVDSAYAVIPVVDNPLCSDYLLCSNSGCNQQVGCTASRISCPKNCIADVVWCSAACEAADRRRHAFECTWLHRFATSIRKKWGEYDFGMLWLIVRILATRFVEGDQDTKGHDHSRKTSHCFPTGWDAIESFCGSQESWSYAQVRRWSALIKKYLKNGPILPHGSTLDELLSIVCKEEANSFGLYPRETGMPLLAGPQVDRGEQFGAAVYPRAAIANHSCCPNVTHKPDDHGRMVFIASRDILDGEECCISYFDLVQRVDVKDRRDHLQTSFRFTCHCPRCVAEEPPKEDDNWDVLPALDEE